jgi:hypothetical protein
VKITGCHEEGDGLQADVNDTVCIIRSVSVAAHRVPDGFYTHPAACGDAHAVVRILGDERAHGKQGQAALALIAADPHVNEPTNEQRIRRAPVPRSLRLLDLDIRVLLPFDARLVLGVFAHNPGRHRGQ